MGGGDSGPGFGCHGTVLFVPESVRKNIRNEVQQMIYLTVVVAVFLFVYLCVALVRPEWF